MGDPPADDPANAIRLSADKEVWRHYYSPALQLISADDNSFGQMLRNPMLITVNAADIQIGIHPVVLKLLANNMWSEAKEWCEQNVSELLSLDYQADGIRLKAGKTWLSRFNDERGESQ